MKALLVTMGLALSMALATDARAEDAADAPATEPAEINVALAKHYMAENNARKARDLDALKTEFGKKWDSLNRQIAKLKQAAAEVEAAKEAYYARGDVKIDTRFSDKISEYDKQRSAAQQERNKLEKQIKGRKAEIMLRYNERADEIQRAYDKIKAALADGQELTGPEMQEMMK